VSEVLEGLLRYVILWTVHTTSFVPLPALQLIYYISSQRMHKVILEVADLVCLFDINLLAPEFGI
jgi:hypothetical protein